MADATCKSDSCIKFPSSKNWSNCGVIYKNEIYGNYVVASRVIEEGEVLIEEYPLTSAPYGIPESLPFCLSCGQPFTFTNCTKCNWPICATKDCQNDPIHVKQECEILAAEANKIFSRGLSLLDYSAIEVLRVLLLYSQDPEKWQKFLQFESHCEKRKLLASANQVTQYVVNFIKENLKLKQFENEIVEKVTGICAVNAFWAFKDFNDRSNASLLFNSVTLLSHDCDPNARHQILENEILVNGTLKKSIYIKIIASRPIERGEQITIYYTKTSDPVSIRRKFLEEFFHFVCECHRCILESQQ